MYTLFEGAVTFHGHRCPGLALGYRAAGVGLKALGADPAGDEEVVAVVENDACGVDGLQVRAGCTFGKGNLRFLDYGKHVYTFYDRASGRGVRVATRPDFSTARFDPGFGALRERVQGGTATPDERGEDREPPPGRLRRHPRGAGRRPLRRDPGRGAAPGAGADPPLGHLRRLRRVRLRAPRRRARRAAALPPLRRPMTSC